jgi:hypothetical protein
MLSSTYYNSDVILHTDKKVKRTWHPELFLEPLNVKTEHAKSANCYTMQYHSATLTDFGL